MPCVTLIAYITLVTRHILIAFVIITLIFCYIFAPFALIACYVNYRRYYVNYRRYLKLRDLRELLTLREYERYVYYGRYVNWLIASLTCYQLVLIDMIIISPMLTETKL